MEYLPFGSLWDGVDPATGIYHSGSWLQQQLMERSLPEELLQLLVTHFFQGLHAAVVQRVGTSAINIEYNFYCLIVPSARRGVKDFVSSSVTLN